MLLRVPPRRRTSTSSPKLRGRATRSRAPATAALAALATVLALLLSAPRAFAGDRVVLVSGVSLEGRIVEEDATSIVLERSVGGGTSRVAIQKAGIRTLERGVPDPSGVSVPSRPSRDEWWLLKSEERTVGTRHLLTVARSGEPSTGDAIPAHGWRLEEHLVFFAGDRTPTVRVDRIEDVTADFRPIFLHYGERGDAGGSSEPYETFRSGPVSDGVWRCTSRESQVSATRDLALPAAARGTLGLREALVRSTPRPLGLVEMPLVDAARVEARTVRAGFTALDVKPAGSAGLASPVGAATPLREDDGDAVAAARSSVRVDVLRVEDGDRVLESRWTPGEPPRCLLEAIAPGVTAAPCTREQAQAAGGPAPVLPDPFEIARARPGDPPKKSEAPQTLTLADVGIALTLPNPAWVATVAAPRPEDVGWRVVASVKDRLDAADVRVEWDPRGGGLSAAEAEAALLARLRVPSPDLVIEQPRAAVPGLPGAWRLRIVGTLRGDRVRTWILVADRGASRVTILAPCPLTSSDAAGGAIETMLASFRWL